MFGLENMVALIIGSGKADLGRKGREPLKRVTDCVGHSTEVRDCRERCQGLVGEKETRMGRGTQGTIRGLLQGCN